VAGVERDGPLEKADRGRGLLIGQDFDVGQPGGAVDADMNELPADATRRSTTLRAIGRPRKKRRR